MFEIRLFATSCGLARQLKCRGAGFPVGRLAPTGHSSGKGPAPWTTACYRRPSAWRARSWSAGRRCPTAGPSARPRTRSSPTPRSCGHAPSSGTGSIPACAPTAAAITGGPAGSPSATSTASCDRCRGRGARPTTRGRRASSAG